MMSSEFFRKRSLIFPLILLIGFIFVDLLLTRYNLKEKKAQLSLEIIQSDKILSSEIYRLLYSLEDDFSFFERKIKKIIENQGSIENTQTLLEFLNTHPHYLKIRITDNLGQEKFKIVQKKGEKTYEESKNLFNLSDQPFFKELNQVKDDGFYFSSMEAHIINGVTENPIRPTVRVAKRIKLKNNQDSLLIINIDGNRIFQLFEGQTVNPNLISEKILVDHKGFNIAGYPLKKAEEYTRNKITISEKFLNILKSQTKIQGTFTQSKDIVNYTKLPLPRGPDIWYLISTIPESSVKSAIYQQHLTRIFWECVIFLIIVSWFLSDERKRHKEHVVQVLLKERSEFIQNASHQLKTPLTIIYNSINSVDNFNKYKEDVLKEINHLIKVVDDLLLLTQVESLDKIPLSKENVLEILNDAISLVGVKALKKSVIIRVNIQTELGQALDALERKVLPDLLKSAFFNILDNAIDFSPFDSIINISLELNNSKILIRFQDQGPGISKSERQFLFKRKLKITSQEGRKGTGVGLAITKKIIDLHHGEINYIEGQGGACFEIII